MSLIGGSDWRAPQYRRPDLGYTLPPMEAGGGSVLGTIFGQGGTGSLGDLVGAVARVGLPIAAELISRHNRDRPETARSLPTAQQRRDEASWWDRAQGVLGIPDDSIVGAAGDAITNWFEGSPSPAAAGGAGMANGGMTLRHAEHHPMFRYRQGSAVGQRVIPVINPMSGKTHFFGDLGTPLLFSRDFAAHKRVNRLARKAGRGKARSRKRR